MKSTLPALLALLTLIVAIDAHALDDTTPARFLPIEPLAAGKAILLTPDRSDWTYPLNTPATIQLKVVRSPYPAAGITLRYRLGPDMREGAEREVVVPAQGLTIPVPAQTAPGFVRLLVRGEFDGQPVMGSATLGFAPHKIVASQIDPQDFDGFWEQQRAALAKVAPEWTLTPAPELSSPTVEVSYLHFQNVGNSSGPSRMYGALSVPRGDGPFPALLELPGAGVRGYTGSRNMAAKGMITLQMGIHGIPVNMPAQVYLDLAKGALSEYNRNQIDDRNSYFYRRVYLGALRAADYLGRHPKWNQRHLIVNGGSQGGQLALMTAALEKRVTAVAAAYPAYSDVSAYLSGGTGGWPHLFKPGADGKPGDMPVDAKLLTTRYYDTANFARRVRVPGFYTWGYNDMVTPPTSVFAAYNLITAPKELLIAPDQGHNQLAAQRQAVEGFILGQAGLATRKENEPRNISQ